MKDGFKFLEEVEQLNEVAPNYKAEVSLFMKSLKGKSDKEIINAVAPKLFRAMKDYDKERIKILKDAFKTEFPNLNIPSTLGEAMSDKKNNLDMFLEGIESVEVSKKPKFHSIHRLYEEKDAEVKKEKEEKKSKCDDEGEEEIEEAIVNEKKDDEEEGAEHEAGETEGEEQAEKEAGDEDEEGGKDEEPEVDEEKKEKCDDEDAEEDAEEGEGEDESGEEEDMDEGAAEDILRALGSDPISGAKDLFDMFVSKLTAVIGEAKAKNEAKQILADLKAQQQQRKAAKPGMPKAPPSSIAAEEDMDEGAQGYAAGLKGVRKDAGAKNLKSGANKVPAPKVAITGDKKLLKKPVTLKGDTYPKSSVAGAARPGAPKVKKS